MRNKKILGIIPARGGSKGIPRKSIKLLAGKPMIAYTIGAALESKYLDRVIVSTEDKEIAELSKKWGAEIIKRPKILATDTAKAMDVVFHTLKVLERESYIPEIVILLQPTSPLRVVDDIDGAIELFLKNGCESVVSACETNVPPYWSFEIEKKYLKPLFGWKYFKKRRQDLKKTYIPNGAMYISTPENLFKYKSFYCKNNMLYVMPIKRSIDIDEEIEFKLTELIIKNGKN